MQRVQLGIDKKFGGCLCLGIMIWMRINTFFFKFRYATRKSPRRDLAACKTTELGQQTDDTPREGAYSPSDRGDVSPAPSSPSRKSPDLQLNLSHEEGIDFIKLNKQKTSVAAKLATQLNNGVPPTNYRKGVVPKYEFKSNFFFLLLLPFFFSFFYLNLEFVSFYTTLDLVELLKKFFILLL